MRVRLLAVLLVLPTVIAGGTLVGSYFAPRENLGYPATQLGWRIVPGRVRGQWNDPPVPVAALPAGTVPPHWPAPPYNGVSFRGGSYLDPFDAISVSRGHYFAGTQATPTRVVNVSLYLPLFLTLPVAFAGIWLWARPSLQERRRRRGLCPRCGYDVRETPSRCPECGAEPAPPGPARARPPGPASA